MSRFNCNIPGLHFANKTIYGLICGSPVSDGFIRRFGRFSFFFSVESVDGIWSFPVKSGGH